MRQLIVVEILVAFLPIVAVWCWGLAMWLSIVFSAGYYQKFDWVYVPFILVVPMGALGLIGVWLLTMDVVSGSGSPKRLGMKLGLVLSGIIALIWALHPLMVVFGWLSLVAYLPLIATLHLAWLAINVPQNKVT